MCSKDKFHSFDALRFFSFLIVFFSHIPYVHFSKNFLGLLEGRGNIGVIFFFVLSGFLITYILLLEKEEKNQIDFRKFMIRRVLRIWPLYYVMILFAYFSPFIINYLNLSSTNIGYSPNWLYTCFFLENYQVISQNEFANVSPIPVMWSLCIEEHFYIIWGLLIFFIESKKMIKYAILIILISLLSKFVFDSNNIMKLEILTNIDYFMYGAIPAYLLIKHKEQTEEIITKISVLLKLITLTLVIVVIFFSKYLNFGLFSFIGNSIYGVLFGFLLMLFLPQKNNFFMIKDSNLFSKLGLYTYGLYLTHVIAISFTEKAFLKFNLLQKNNFILFICSSLILTIVASYFSYNLVEKPFLRLKQKFKSQSPSKHNQAVK